MASRLTEKPEETSEQTSGRTHPRAWFRVTLIILAFFACIIPHLIWRLFKRQSPFAIWFLRTSGWLAGARVTVRGMPRTAYTFFIANHLSWLDILVLAGVSKTAFVAKADMAGWPVFGWMADQNNTIYVKREKALDSRNQANALQTALMSGQPATLFPEGTTAGGDGLLPFRSSLIAAVVPCPDGIDIQPVAIDYGALATQIAWTDAESVGKNALRLMSRKGTIPITLHFLEPLDPTDFKDRKAIARHSQERIAKALGVTKMLPGLNFVTGEPV
jgi:lyso-ornithine lipid O-acyltransferase